MRFVEEVLQKLGDRVRVRGDAGLSRTLLQHFPFAVGRVDWTRVPDARIQWAPPERALGANSPDVPFQTSHYLPVVERFLRNALADYRIEDEWVAFCSDSVDEEFEVRLDSLEVLLRVSSDVPDHKYVFGLNANWCFTWSMEDDLHFGLAPRPS